MCHTLNYLRQVHGCHAGNPDTTHPGKAKIPKDHLPQVIICWPNDGIKQLKQETIALQEDSSPELNFDQKISYLITYDIEPLKVIKAV